MTSVNWQYTSFRPEQSLKASLLTVLIEIGNVTVSNSQQPLKTPVSRVVIPAPTVIFFKDLQYWNA